MRNIRIVADSSANLTEYKGVDFSFAPMKIIAGDKEFVDDINLDANKMVEFFDSYKNRSQTSCPNFGDWIEAFGDAEEIICVTITSGLSGSYNSACVAKDTYETEHPGRKVFVLDSLSAGPELVLFIEKAQELIAEDKPFEEICSALLEYRENTSLLFMLESLNNFAANGRISPAVAKITGFLGIRVVGKASDKGQLQPLNKCRGEAKSLDTIFSHMKDMGWKNGKVRIAHCKNIGATESMSEKIRSLNPGADIEVIPCRGLCSYYAEKGGMLIAFEKN